MLALSSTVEKDQRPNGVRALGERERKLVEALEVIANFTVKRDVDWLQRIAGAALEDHRKALQSANAEESQPAQERSEERQIKNEEEINNQ